MKDDAQEIFLDALDVPSADREAWIDARCVDAPDVAAEVRALLVADRDAEGFLEPPLGDADPIEDERGRWLEGRTIGGYAILRRIGIGGMGTVYEAMQTRPRRKVALKLLRTGFITPELQRRFELEAEILGRLRHRAIAEIYEAGTYDSELGPIPFFALEYIDDARTLSQWTTEHQPDAHTLVGMVIEICEAIEHAHQQRVIHRDIKPSNILVGRDGRPRLIDFGVARATDDESRRVTLATAVGELVGTLHYMSPEQCAFDGTELDGRTDVYSLGVVLYELLAGRLPYPVEGVAPAMLPALVRSHAPTPPLRGTTRRWPDLDAVVLTALEKDPAHRYASASVFADDLRRAIAGEPVRARRSRRMYRLRRLVWRGRRTLPFAVMTGGLALGAWSVLRTPSEERVPPSSAQADERPADTSGELRERYRHRLAVAERARDDGDRGQAKRALLECPEGERGWEWDRLRAQLDVSVASHTMGDPVDAIAIDPQRGRLAAVTASGTVVMLTIDGSGETPRLEPRWTVATGDAYLALAIDPVHGGVVVGGDRGTLHVIDDEGHAGADFGAHPSSIWGLAMVDAPAGLLVAREDGRLQRWDLPTQELRWEQRLGERVGRIAVARTHYIAAIDDAGVVLGEIDTGKVVRRLDVAERPESIVVDDVGIAAAGWERRITEFDAQGTPIAGAEQPLPAPVLDLAVLDARTLALASTDGVLRLWDRTEHRVRDELRGHDADVRTVDVTARGRWLASGSADGTVRLWDPERGPLDRVLTGAAEKIHAVAWTNDGATLVTGSGVEWDRSDANELVAWSVADGTARARTLDHTATIEAVVTSSTEIVSADRDGFVVVRDLDLKPKHRVQAHLGPVRALAVVGTAIVSGGEDGTLARWHDGELLSRVSAGVGPVHALASRDDLVVAAGERGLTRWFADGSVATIAGSNLSAVAVLANGDLVLGDDAGSLALVDAEGTTVWRVDTLARRVHAVAVDPRATRVAIAGDDGRIRLFDARDGAALTTVGTHEMPAMAVAFSPDGSALASGGFDLLARIWGSTH